jgi:hypothetical protein
MLVRLRRPGVPEIIGWTLRLITAAALAVDAYVHADLVERYDPNRSGGLSQGDLFRIEAGVSALAALLVLVLAWRVVWALAFVVGASAFAAVMVYAHYDIKAIGPIPDMYEPIWYSEKTLAAYAEAVATAGAALGLVVALLVKRRARAVSYAASA